MKKNTYIFPPTTWHPSPSENNRVLVENNSVRQRKWLIPHSIPPSPFHFLWLAASAHPVRIVEHRRWYFQQHCSKKQQSRPLKKHSTWWVVSSSFKRWILWKKEGKRGNKNTLFLPYNKIYFPFKKATCLVFECKTSLYVSRTVALTKTAIPSILVCFY